jgi:Xaa-Pro aminopeptidase
MLGGASREGYGSIVASGDAATTLHYVFNDQTCRDGDLLLVDAGAEYNYYTADITRTFPVNGRFSAAQKDIYQRVLDCQKEIISMIRPGLSFQSLQERTISKLIQAMQDLGLLTESKDEIIERALYKKYYPHNVSHWLGMDVHDMGLYKMGGANRSLQSGMVFTVEPGLYIPRNDESAPEAFRGIGVRIEENIVVTETGHDVLTDGVPKEIDDIEALMARR